MTTNDEIAEILELERRTWLSLSEQYDMIDRLSRQWPEDTPSARLVKACLHASAGRIKVLAALNDEGDQP